MNTKNFLIASLFGALVTTFFVNFPIINYLNCLVCLPFWGGPLFTVWFYKRLTGTMTMKQALYVGLLTGSLAGVFGFVFVMLQMAGAGLVLQLDQYLPPDQVPYLFMGPTALIFHLVVVIISMICGLIGGLIGGAIWQDKAPAATIPNQ